MYDSQNEMDGHNNYVTATEDLADAIPMIYIHRAFY